MTGFQKLFRNTAYARRRFQRRMERNIDTHLARQERFYEELQNGSSELQSYITAFEQG